MVAIVKIRPVDAMLMVTHQIKILAKTTNQKLTGGV